MTMPTDMEQAAAKILQETLEEMRFQYDKWGDQKGHPDGTQEVFKATADMVRTACDQAFAVGMGNWKLILEEEFYEALAEVDPEKLRKELIQVAGVAISWVSAIDRRDNG